MDKQQCKEWLEAHNNSLIISNDNDCGWSIVSGEELKKIDYCPFCGSVLDEDGCTSDLGLEVPF